MGIMVYSLLWVMQDFDHQPYVLLYVIATRSGGVFYQAEGLPEKNCASRWPQEPQP